MRRSRKPLSVVRRIEGSNPSPSARHPAAPMPKGSGASLTESRRGVRAAEGARLEIAYSSKGGSRVQIPPFPLEQSPALAAEEEAVAALVAAGQPRDRGRAAQTTPEPGLAVAEHRDRRAPLSPGERAGVAFGFARTGRQPRK